MPREVEPSPVVLITSPDPYKLRDLLERESNRHALIVRADIREVVPGLWVAEVVQLRRFERPWVKPAAVSAGCVAALGGAAAAGWWLLGALTDVVSAALGVSGAAALGVLAVLAIVLGATRRSHRCEVTVRVRHR